MVIRPSDFVLASIEFPCSTHFYQECDEMEELPLTFRIH